MTRISLPFTPCKQICVCGKCCPRLCPCPGGAPQTIQGGFQEHIELLQTAVGERMSAIIEVSKAERVSVFIKNLGDQPIVSFLQNSPDGIAFVSSPAPLTLDPGQLGYHIPYIFSRYIRTVVESEGIGTVRIWYQIQNRNYALW